VKLWTRQAVDYTERFSAIAEAVRALPVDDCMLDGEAVAFNDSAYDFHALRTRAGQQSASLIAFDLLDLEGADLRTWAVEARREALVELLQDAPAGLSFSEQIDGEGLRYSRRPAPLDWRGSSRSGADPPIDPADASIG
jgi:bifunctional non-homologous end joining protein LigD